MKKERITGLLWVLAFILTLALAVFQRLTGPTYPLTGKEALRGIEIHYKMLRSYMELQPLPVQIKAPDGVTAWLNFKRYKTPDEWTEMEMKRQGDFLVGEITGQPAAGKIEYSIRMQVNGENILLNKGRSIVARFRGEPGRGDHPPPLERAAAPRASPGRHPLRRPAELPLELDADAARPRPLPEPDRGLGLPPPAPAGEDRRRRHRGLSRRLRGRLRARRRGPEGNPHRREEAAPGGAPAHPGPRCARERASVTRREIREALGVPDSTVRRWLCELVELEYLAASEGARAAPGKTTRYRLVAREANGGELVLGLLTPAELRARL